MDSVFYKLFPRARFGKPYESQEDYLADLVKKTELTLFAYVQAGGGRKTDLDRFRGVIITEEQVRHTLSFEDGMIGYRSAIEQLRRKAEFVIDSRKEASSHFFAIDYLFDIYKLNELEQFYFMLCLMPQFDQKYERVFGYLQDDVTVKYPTCNLALQLFHVVESCAEIKDAQNGKNALKQKFQLLCFDGQEGLLDPNIAEFVRLGSMGASAIPGIQLVLPNDEVSELPAMGDIADRVIEAISTYTRSDTLIFYLHGPTGAGKKTIAKFASQQLNMALLHASLSELTEMSDKGLEQWGLSVCRQALLQRAFLCFEGLPNEEDDPVERRRLKNIVILAQQFCSVIFLCSAYEQHFCVDVPRTIWLDCPVPEPDKEQSIALWAYYMKDLPLSEAVEAYEMANKFRFSPGQIAGTAETARKQLLWGRDAMIDRQMLSRCAYEQVVHTLGQQATLLHAGYSMQDLILADAEKEMLQNACDQIRYKHIVYDRWGFQRRLTYGRGVSMLFAGPPGTGKTMAAQVVAKELNIEIYQVDLSQIVSKYIGETEKNLNALFREAQKSNVILFFDETDALLGKRTEVKDSHDKNANLETSYLLQKMEEYDGITIMTTNYLENIDSAFFRRISYVIHFPFPDESARLQLWKAIFPTELPKADDIDYPYLARQFEIAGGNIKNTAVTAAFLAAKHNGPLEMKHIIKALKYEISKQGKIVLSEDFGEYSYLIN